MTSSFVAAATAAAAACALIGLIGWLAGAFDWSVVVVGAVAVVVVADGWLAAVVVGGIDGKKEDQN
jgi:hypothetical protein